MFMKINIKFYRPVLSSFSTLDAMKLRHWIEIQWTLHNQISSVPFSLSASKTLDTLKILILGSRWYGLLDFAKRIFFVIVLLFHLHMWPIYLRYWAQATLYKQFVLVIEIISVFLYLKQYSSSTLPAKWWCLMCTLIWQDVL